jgi:diguanylate cyclase (GGDEF)-like protein/PAS domain S-box-containing protein
MGVLMAGSKQSRRGPTKGFGYKSAGLCSADSAARIAHDLLDDDVRAWLDDLTAASRALRHQVNTQENDQLTDAASRLERLQEALRRAPGRLLKRMRQRIIESPLTKVPSRRDVTQAMLTDETLPEKGRLAQEIAERERLEKQHREAEQGLREARERFESAFGNAPIGMALIDMDGRWLQVNSALCRITGYAEADLKRTTLHAITLPEDVELDAGERQDLLSGKIPSYQVEKRYRHAWGHYVWVLLTVSLVRDQRGNALYVISQVQDISERKAVVERLEHLVDRDALTGLLNRRRFAQELARETERAARYGAPGAVLLIDLDNFKELNDTFGHATGDEMLKGVASVLKLRLRQTDLIARVGGDEFAVLLPAADADRAQIVADELVKSLDRTMVVLTDRSIHITASIGVAMFDRLSDTEILAYADLAMYEAKEAGRNRFALYRAREGRRKVVSEQLAEAEQIRHALENDQFLLYGQPILDLRANLVSNCELLLRLPDPAGEEPLQPSTFLYAAERFGLIQAIDAWVVRKAIDVIVERVRAGRRLPLHVNISGKSIGDAKFIAFAEQALAESKIDPTLLIFELTETAAISNLEQAKRFITQLRDFGCGFALDDFGAGFGSFHYIINLPFDYLKIDGIFIRNLGASVADRLVVQALVGIAKGLGKKTIAEFVGDAATMSLLSEIGVDCAQGYHIGPPQPLVEVLDTLQ